MKKRYLAGTSFVLLSLAAVAANTGGVPRSIAPPEATPEAFAAWLEANKDPEAMEKAAQEAAKTLEYKGTTAVAEKSLAGNDHVKQVCKLLSQTDFVPEQRIRRFSSLAPHLSLVEWSLTVEKVEVGLGETLVQLRSNPVVAALGEGAISIFSFYRESYRVVDGKLHFIGSDPIPDNPTINFVIN